MGKISTVLDIVIGSILSLYALYELHSCVKIIHLGSKSLNWPSVDGHIISIDQPWKKDISLRRRCIGPSPSVKTTITYLYNVDGIEYQSTFVDAKKLSKRSSKIYLLKEYCDRTMINV